VTRPDVTAWVEIELWLGEHYLMRLSSPPMNAAYATTFRVGARIPGDFLNEQVYQARFRLHALGHYDAPSAAVVTAEERLDFRVINAHPERSVWKDWPGVGKGFISPRLAWQFSRVD
jgi:hypothetical protein